MFFLALFDICLFDLENSFCYSVFRGDLGPTSSLEGSFYA